MDPGRRPTQSERPRTALNNVRIIGLDLREEGLAVFDRFKPRAEGTLWYYGALAEVFARRLDNPLSHELTCAVRDMQELVAAADPAGRWTDGNRLTS